MFGKRPDNVVQRIDGLIAQLPGDLLLFKEISYLDAYQRSQRAFEITRDGFTLLGMGFTGIQALRWKLAYIAR